MLLVELPQERDNEEVQETKQEHMRQEQMRQEQMRQEQMRQEQMRQEQMRQEQMRQEQMRQEQMRQEQMKEEVRAVEEPPTESLAEVLVEVETAEGQRPPRHVKRQCYGCAEVVCSCPSCDRR